MLDSSIYVLLFRDWKTFLEIAAPYLAGENLGRDVRKFGIEIDDLTGE